MIGLTGGAGFLWRRIAGARTPLLLPHLTTRPLDLMGRERVTGREVLDQRCRRIGRIVCTGFGLCVAGLAGTVCGLFCVFVFIPFGLLIAFFGIWYAHLSGVRCPWCRAELGRLAGGGLVFAPRVQRCPYCERRLDDEVADSDSLADPPRPEVPVPASGAPPVTSASVRPELAPVPRVTGRMVLNHRPGRVSRLTYLGAGLALVGLVGGAAGARMLLALLVVGFWLAGLGFVSTRYSRTRCPWCRVSLYGLSNSDALFDARVRLCPYCEHRLDEELPEQERICVVDREDR
ncbi:hypothetical protein [Frigoriglobus tundricola]|uniref:hypothetical protein n=1 Tax=Frigoriglobus tundricola TaxID=2774151 RepID=UPI00148EDC61|nr:hypothetical protein [Frigoriglobus tundricola]